LDRAPMPEALQAYQELRGRYDIRIEIPDAVREAWQSE